MPITTRSQNMDLIRWLNFGHEHTSKLLSSITNANYVSKMATGDKAISDSTARSIERTLELPKGWMDRDNIKLLKMSDPVFHLYQIISELSEKKQKALFQLLASDNADA